MRAVRAVTLQCLALALLALCVAVSAQNNNQPASSTQAPSSTNAPASSASGTASPSSAVPSGSASRSGTAAPSSSVSGSSTANITSTSTTPSTFPIATVPSTGYLAGTAAAPVPAGASGAQGTAASGPNDSHVVSAARMLRSPLAASVAGIVALGAGVWVLL